MKTNFPQAVVTGAAGFIGSHLVEALLGRGYRVVGIDNLDPFYDESTKRANLDALSSDSFEFIEGDIRDRGHMRSVFANATPELVVHLAALAGVRPSIEAPYRYADVNVNGTVSLLDAARDVGCTRFLFASSSSVYGNNEKVPFSEVDPVNDPISPYAATKRAGELICHTYSHLFEMEIACLRFFTVYGPRQRPDLAIAKFMRAIAAGEPIEMFGDGSTSRDYTYIDDIVEGILRAAERIGSADIGRYRIWNLGGSSPVSLREMIDAVALAVGRTPNVVERPMQPGDVNRTWADVSRVERELQYRPHVPFETGLAQQWEWMNRRTASVSV